MFLLLALVACGHHYECCVDGHVDTCFCAAPANCVEGGLHVEEDGSCHYGDRDTADSGDSGS